MIKISQGRILELLGKGKPMTRAELKEITDLSNVALCHALKQLLKYNEILKNYSNKGIPCYKLKKKRKKKKARRGFKTPSQKIKNKTDF